jgi:hypothetical protein
MGLPERDTRGSEQDMGGSEQDTGGSKRDTGGPEQSPRNRSYAPFLMVWIPIIKEGGFKPPKERYRNNMTDWSCYFLIAHAIK